MTHPRVLLLGFDAMDPDLVDEWSRAGVLPAFASLAQRAASATTHNPEGLYVGAVWPSFFTGVSPARHGRYCYSQIVPGTYTEQRFHSDHLKRRPFWVPLSEAAHRVAVVDVPKSPLTAAINGIQVKDWGTHDPEHGAAFATWPVSLAEPIVARYGRDPVGECDLIERTAAGYTMFRDNLLTRIERKTALCRELLLQEEWDLFLGVFAESHCVGHQAWTLHDRTHRDYQSAVAAEIGNPLRDVYIALDRALGALLEHAGPDTTVIVLASHGMGPHFDATFMLDEILERLEPPPGVWERVVGAPARALTDRLRQRLRRRRTPQERRGRQLERRQSFAVPNNDVYGGIRVNLAGREPRGRIQPGQECDAYFTWLRQELLQIVNLDTGEPIVRDLIRSRDHYVGEYLESLPDFLVEWNREAPISRVASPRLGTFEKQFDGLRNGDHKPEGSCWIAGPGIAPGQRLAPVSVMDFAPTVGALLQTPIPDVDGHPIAVGELSGTAVELELDRGLEAEKVRALVEAARK
jgi:predicted AlkP superfamily phosphohydrolase/phosphomutase